MRRQETTPRGADRLDRSAWAQAALQAMREGGLAAVVVETLAERLGTTKGSFYWHFKDRDELVVTGLELWEQEMTEAVIARLETVGDPVVRLRQLFDLMFADQPGGFMTTALLSHAQDPRVGPVLQRVTRRRLTYLTGALVECGVPPDRAHHHAVVAATAYLGYFGLQRQLPDEAVFGAEAKPYLRHLLHVLEAELPAARVRPSGA
ncbi:MAG TPA: TetR/AcrR family transcriptional regulator [Candidatus Dormibacteraeota bacterium]|nr:TetR/AcrR family transcriptional regulator [Candidatus Dormibacteraeota bacterium]